jgi:steroid delta-isomerase-like uncharacterized protein
MSIKTLDEQRAEIRDLSDAMFNEKAYDRIADGYAEDIVMHNVPQGEDVEGIEAFEEWVRANHEAFPDFHVDIEDVVVGEEKTVTQYVATGTHEGPLPWLDIEPTGEEVEFRGTTVHRMEDGKAVEAWWYYDRLELLQQLGVVPEQPPA